MLPAMCNEFVAVTKETSLASTFYVGDLMTRYQTISGKNLSGHRAAGHHRRHLFRRNLLHEQADYRPMKGRLKNDD
ncbi:MAG: hypothetical protein ACLVB5_02340 [Christensenellales bacterium]